MSSFITFSGVRAATPDRRALFPDLTLSIGAERVGLVGRNGSGKSTLLHIAAGMAEPAAGSVSRAGSVGMLAQHWPEGNSVAQALGVDAAIAPVERIVAGHGTAEDFDGADWALMPRIEAALAEVGLPGLSLERRIGTLSGGERTRVGLARLMLERPDLLLLDEPTNNLDAGGRAAVQALIAGWHGGVLLASHDRALLEGMDRIVELTPIGVHVGGGGWSAFAARREAERAQAVAEHGRSEAAVHDTKRAVQAGREAKDRRDKAGRAFAARKSEPRILLGRQAEEAQARLGEARARVEVLTPLTITLPASGVPSHAELLSLDAVTVDVGARQLGPWTLTLRGPERVAITGDNGVGKTTLLQIATGARVPDGGLVRRAQGRIAALDQHVALLAPGGTILDNLRRLHPTVDAQAAYAACARFAFRNRDAERVVGTLSGGERLRAGLMTAMSREVVPWLLILDEPTNHLDLASIEELQRALCSYDGALLVVSHDRAFLDAIGIGREVQLS
jgi:ATPase subunit of ABC transporter with duplicated ATPase domains